MARSQTSMQWCSGALNMLLSYQLVQTFFVLVVLINVSCVVHSSDETNGTHLEAKVGSYVILKCRIDFPDEFEIPYVIRWNKDGKRIFTLYDEQVAITDTYAGRFSLIGENEEYGRASVNLTSIRESDQGWYHCQIVFPNRTPSTRNNGTWYHLTVEGGSLIRIPPINQTILEGQTAFFHCSMKYPEKSNVTWYKDGMNLREIPDLYQRSLFGPEGSLSIVPTLMSDMGEYECNVQSSDGEVQRARAFLNIQYKAKVIYSPPEVYFPYGQPAILDCHFRANPPLTNLRWEKDGLLFDSYNVPGVFYKMNGSLYFAKVEKVHAGIYTCTPFNELGTEGPSPPIAVIVQRPPTFTITPRPVYIYKLGENAQMFCDAIDSDDNHRPHIEWTRKDGVPLPTGRYRLDGGNLTILHITEADRGIYQCSANNEAATIAADTELMIENIAPRPPYNLTADSTETSITLRWQPGYIRSSLEYSVWYRLSSAAEWRMKLVPSRNVMEATINDLIPGREYEFMVLTRDRYGDGMFSKLFRYSTKGQASEVVSESLAPFVQIGPPKNLTVEKRADGYFLTWEPPSYGINLLRMYVIRWWVEPSHILQGSIETNNTYYVIRHLKEDETYTLKVYALSNNDDYVGSDEIEIVVPSKRIMRAVAIGCTVGIIFLITAISVFLYVKKSWFRHIKSSADKAGT